MIELFGVHSVISGFSSLQAVRRCKGALGSIGVALLLVLTVGAPPAWAQLGHLRRDGSFTITWNVDRSDSEKVAVVGWVRSAHKRTASQVRLWVQGVNAWGQVVSRAVGSVDHEVSPEGESFFEIRLTPMGTEVIFHVSVVSFRVRERTVEAP